VLLWLCVRLHSRLRHYQTLLALEQAVTAAPESPPPPSPPAVLSYPPSTFTYGSTPYTSYRSILTSSHVSRAMSLPSSPPPLYHAVVFGSSTGLIPLYPPP
jgi:hypothetical protein